VAGIAPLLWLGELPDNGMSFAHEDFVGLSFGPSTMAAAFVWALLHQGLPEELFFRGLLLGQLARKLSVAAAIVVQGGVFWAIHVPAYVYLWQGTQQAVPRLLTRFAVLTLGVSLLLGWLRMRDANRSLLPPIIAHTLANGITFTTAMLLA
jgi:membrane protease YdiL (CAAX protease family)